MSGVRCSLTHKFKSNHNSASATWSNGICHTLIAVRRTFPLVGPTNRQGHCGALKESLCAYIPRPATLLGMPTTV